MGAGSFDRSASIDFDSLPPDGLAWPPDPEVISALGGVGLGGALGPLGKTHGGGHHSHIRKFFFFFFLVSYHFVFVLFVGKFVNLYNYM
jgi:hypothetical protein